MTRPHETDGMLTIMQSELYMTNACIVETPDLVLVADPCWLPREVAALRDEAGKRIRAGRTSGGKPLYALFTHSDFDHIIGCGAFPDAKAIGSAGMAERADKERIVEQIRQFDDDYYLIRDYPVRYPTLDVAVREDGQTFEAGGTRLTFYLAPGHTEDGLLTVVEPGGILIAGDYLSDVEFPIIDYDSRAYRATLDKLERIIERHRIAVMVPGHGHAATERKEMKRRIDVSRRYMMQLAEAVRQGDEAAFAAMIEGWPFPRNLRRCHEANRKQLERELAQGQGSGQTDEARP